MGGEAAAQAVKWANVGGGSLSLIAVSASPWLLASVTGDQVQVAVNSAGLTPGFYSGVVRLAAVRRRPVDRPRQLHSCQRWGAAGRQ